MGTTDGGTLVPYGMQIDRAKVLTDAHGGRTIWHIARAFGGCETSHFLRVGRSVPMYVLRKPHLYYGVLQVDGDQLPTR